MSLSNLIENKNSNINIDTLDAPLKIDESICPFNPISNLDTVEMDNINPEMDHKLTANDAFEKIRALYKNTALQGAAFEEFLILYMITDPQYRSVIDSIKKWQDWQEELEFDSCKDLGIDVIAKTKTGDYWAIQCKFYNPTALIDKSDVSKFITQATKRFRVNGVEKNFSLAVFVTTTNNFTDNAITSLLHQSTPAIKITLSNFEGSQVNWDKLLKGITGEDARPIIYQPFDYQQMAINTAIEYYKTHTRGKLTMACGTGKTLVSLHIAQILATDTKLVLFCVPSISLVAQILREWSNQSKYGKLNFICVCSDSNVSRAKHKTNITDDNDEPLYTTLDLAYPASTNAENVINNYNKACKNEITAIFATYQSIDVITKAHELGLPQFDLIICDEAHRTTGIHKSTTEDVSCFIRVHEDSNVNGKLRLYMTATPRIYDSRSKEHANRENIVLYSMDDVEKYGETIYQISFKEAVERGCLTDYKVMTLTINEDIIPFNDIKNVLDVPDETGKRKPQKQLDLEIGTTAKLLGCINAMSKHYYSKTDAIRRDDPSHMKKVLAYCQNIKLSKAVSATFNMLSEQYIRDRDSTEIDMVESRHIDGTMSSSKRDSLLSWIKRTNDCKGKILTNVKCLTEGIDVPDLDGIIFLSKKNSVIDIIQSVGRVMRRSIDKKFGYLIIPVIIPSDGDASTVLSYSDTHRLIWNVINALRAHDPDIDEMIHQIVYNIEKPPKFEIVNTDERLINANKNKKAEFDQMQINLFKQLMHRHNEIVDLIYGKLIENSSITFLWYNWAKNIQEIADRHIDKLTKLSNSDKYNRMFDDFVKKLSNDISNGSLSRQSVIEMLAQHKITEPVFNALFKKFEFTKHNPMSIEIDAFLDRIKEDSDIDGNNVLRKFYENVKSFASSIDNDKGRQAIVVKLYNSFFKEAFPDTAKDLGIVYTPIPIVDFIINSVDDIAKAEFGVGLTDEGVNIIDPFTGTGTFITRLLQSKVIKDKDLKRKYEKEIFICEIVLLAYYIATVNIETEYSIRKKNEEYEPFKGACLADTFQTGENDQLVIDNSENAERIIKLRNTKMTVIMGNPPYSVNGSKNELSKTITYPKLDASIQKHYIMDSHIRNIKSLYDSYIRSFRYATDKIGNDNGIIAYVTNGSWITTTSNDALRLSFEKEFSKIYIFDLRGDGRTTGDIRLKEGAGVFGEWSRTPVTIAIFVKKKDFIGKATIHYRDIGNYLTKTEKFKIIENARSFLSDTMPEMITLTPNKQGDWLKKRNVGFERFYPLAPDRTSNYLPNADSVFSVFTLGVATGRDHWVVCLTNDKLRSKVSKTINHYNQQIVNGAMDDDPKKISLNEDLKKHLKRQSKTTYCDGNIRNYLYRPFSNRLLYYCNIFVDSPRMFKSFFPSSDSENLIISISGPSGKNDFSVLISDKIVDYSMLESTRCFPLYYYENPENTTSNQLCLAMPFPKNAIGSRSDGITDYFASRINTKYNEKIEKIDIFFYVYGILHSRQYTKSFKDDLKLSLPRIPIVESISDFWKFSKAGRNLADLHLNYDKVPHQESVKIVGDQSNLEVSKMMFQVNDNIIDKSTIIFNNRMKIANIPISAYDYVLNGRSAIGHVMEWYRTKRDVQSGITTDPNDYCIEQNNPRYILDLLLSVISLSVKTLDIVNSLPKLDLIDDSSILI
ncbi:MAG: DEAD/DEAH box helicase family protein [Christensenellaceae bacterium]|nr:DEAD/DEAH box helicase family protein [Christensenellaceae bacterium]